MVAPIFYCDGLGSPTKAEYSMESAPMASVCYGLLSEFITSLLSAVQGPGWMRVIFDPSRPSPAIRPC